MKIKSEDLLDDLKSKTLKMIQCAESFQKLSIKDLNRQPGEEKWSILECVGHLNLYSDFYIDEFESKISASKHTASKYHKVGFLGGRFTKSMLPIGDSTPMKMKTFKSKKPNKSKLSIVTLEKFVYQQIQIIQLIDKSRDAHLVKIKCDTTIKNIKLRLGDTLRFYVFHNIRHIVQANRIIGKRNDF
jgi:uncharacterized damage-inducible protein DinB